MAWFSFGVAVSDGLRRLREVELEGKGGLVWGWRGARRTVKSYLKLSKHKLSALVVYTGAVG